MANRSRNQRCDGPPPHPEDGREVFIGEGVEVEGDGVHGPSRIIWRGRTYDVSAVLRAWHDRSQPPGTLRPSWRTRHHRNYFDVMTRSGERFRLYLERGTKLGAKRTWILERILGSIGEGEI